jgi:SPP1 gp7 family putative phage head morphogenesis protein
MTLDGTQIARDWTARRVAVPLSGSSVVLTRDPAFPAAVRMNALFVSRTASANALAGLRGQIEGVLAGGTTPAQAAKVLRASFESDAGAGGLVSPGRAEQIVRQQAMQAYAVGERAVALHPAVQEAFPYFRYEATQDDRTRPGHRALDGLVLRKDDPFWRTHTPPWEFGCRCALAPVSAEEAQALGIGTVTPPHESDAGQSATVVTGKGRTVSLPGNASGYTFDVEGAFSESDMGQVKELKDRRQILDEMVAAARESERGWSFVARQEMPLAGPVLPKPESEIAADIARVAAGEVESMSLGKLLPEHADGLGLKPDEHEVRLSATETGHEFGTGHWGPNHPETWTQAPAMLAETLWQPAAEARLGVRGGTVRLVLWNRATNHLATFIRKGREWQLETVDVWQPTEGYRKARMLQ